MNTKKLDKKIKIRLIIMLNALLLAALSAMIAYYLNKNFDVNQQTIYSSVDSNYIYLLQDRELYYSIATDQKTVKIFIPFEEVISEKQQFIDFSIPVEQSYLNNIIDGKFGFDLQVQYNILTGSTSCYYRFYIQKTINKKVHKQDFINKKDNGILL